MCDSTAWLASVYASYMMDKTKSKDVYAFRKVLKRALETYSEYDYCFYLPKMFEVQKDSVRSEWDDDLNKQAETIDKKVMAFMELFDIKYIRVECTDNMDRVNYIRQCIGIDKPLVQ